MELALDTAFNQFWMLEESCLVQNDAMAYIFSKGQIIKHKKIDELYSETMGYHPVKIAADLFLIDKKFNYDIKNKATIGYNLLYARQHLKVKGDYVGYIRGDSVFINNFVTNREQFVIYNGTNHGMNSRYVWIQREYPDEGFIFLYKENKIVKLPLDFYASSTENAWMMVNYDFMADLVIAKNTNLEDLIVKDDRYDGCGLLQDLAIFTSRRKKSLVFKKGKKVNLNLNIVKVECYEELDLCIFKTKSGKYGIIDGDGELVEKPIYDYISKTLFENEIFLKKQSHCKLMVDKKVVFETENVDGIDYLGSDIYVVKTGNFKKVVNGDGKVILDFKTKENFYLMKHTDIDLIYQVKSTSLKSKERKYTMWDTDGNRISHWNDEPSDTFFKSFVTVKNFNLKMLKNMSPTNLKKVYPGGIVILSKKDDDGKVDYYFIDLVGNILSHAYDLIIQLDHQGHFLIKTFSEKVGIVKYSHTN